MIRIPKEQFIDIVKTSGFKVQEDKSWNELAAVSDDELFFIVKYDLNKSSVCTTYPGPYMYENGKLFYHNGKKSNGMNSEMLLQYLSECKRKEKELIRKYRLKKINEL